MSRHDTERTPKEVTLVRQDGVRKRRYRDAEAALYRNGCCWQLVRARSSAVQEMIHTPCTVGYHVSTTCTVVTAPENGSQLAEWVEIPSPRAVPTVVCTWTLGTAL